MIPRLINKPKYLLALIFLFGLILRIVFFGGMEGFDSFLYTHSAWNIASGHFSIIDIKNPSEFRFLITLPTALSFYLFGLNDFSSVLWPLLCSLGTVMLIFYLGKILFDVRTALLAAFFLSFFPLEVNYAARLFPDVILSFFICLSVFLFLKAEKAHSKKAKVSQLLASGFILGLSFLSKELALVFVLFFAVYTIYYKKNLRGLLIFICGVAFFLSAFWLFLYFKTGDFWFQIRTNMQIVSKDVNMLGNSVIQKHNLLVYPKGMFGLNLYGLASFGLFYYFIALAFLFVIFKRIKKVYALIFWFLILFIYLEFGISSLRAYFVPKCLRYLSILTPPALLALAFFWKSSLPQIEKIYALLKHSSKATVIPLLLVTSIFGSYRMKIYNHLQEIKYQEAYKFLKDKPVKNIFCANADWSLRLNYYFKYKIGRSYQNPLIGFTLFADEENEDKIFRNFFKVKDYREIKDAYIITDDSALLITDEKGNMLGMRCDVPAFMNNIPRQWRYLYGRNDVKIYLAPKQY